MEKEPYNDDKFYEYSSDKYDDPKEFFEYFKFYSIPDLDNYMFQNYKEYFSLAENDVSFVWYPSQIIKLTEFQFDRIKSSIKELKDNVDPSQSEIYRKRCSLENQILLNAYQFFTYQDYLKACKILLEVGGQRFEQIVYNPPMEQIKFIDEKQRILRSMIEKDIFTPDFVIGGNTIFPDCYL